MKFLRALPYVTSSSASHEVAQIIKFAYEFWGYCLNGTSATSFPGGFALTTPSNFPTNFTEGTSVLASGTNGVTVAGSNTFTATGASFTMASHYNKYLVMWVPGSDCTDDSIYQITGVPSSTTLRLTDATGGTPQPGSMVPTLTSRSSINYRIVDVNAAAATASPTPQYLVFQTVASNVNVGQANSQFMLRYLATNNLGVIFSPLGSWSGAEFGADSSSGISPSTGSWFGSNGTNVSGAVTMIANYDFLIIHAASGNSTTTGSAKGGVLHVETPIRIYTQTQDPAPFAVMVETGGAQTLSAASYYSGAVNMIGTDHTTRKINTLTRSLHGDGPFPVTLPTVMNGVLGTAVDERFVVNGALSKILASEALFSMMGVSGQFAVGRCKAKNLRFVSTNTPSMTLIEDRGTFLHVGNGVCWPWDGAILGNLFTFGL